MGATSTVRVMYRSLELAPAATLTERDGGQRFLALDTPPPVRTVLGLVRGDDAPIAVEVIEAIEVEAPGAPRGCIVREVDTARLQRPAVGSERLASGAGGHEAPREADPAGEQGSYDEGYAAAMAVPAPVVGDAESSDAIDVDGRGDADDSDDTGDEATPSSGDAEGGGPAPAKKRRGRKRR